MFVNNNLTINDKLFTRNDIKLSKNAYFSAFLRALTETEKYDFLVEVKTTEKYN